MDRIAAVIIFSRVWQVVSGGVTQTVTYDVNGNTVSKVGGGITTSYEWDAVNRLTAVNQGTHRSEFAYDGLSRRVRIIEKESGTLTSDKRFLWDGVTIAEERDGTGATVAKRYFSQGVQISSSLQNSNTPLSLFYTRDHLGSIREITDNTGVLRARYDYDPYGRRTKVSGDLDADFGFTGHYFHAASGLNLTWFRPYEADWGRWCCADPIKEEGGINIYNYVANNPVNQVDLLGLCGGDSKNDNPFAGLNPSDFQSREDYEWVCMAKVQAFCANMPSPCQARCLQHGLQACHQGKVPSPLIGISPPTSPPVGTNPRGLVDIVKGIVRIIKNVF